jgi:hypothetical protein
LALLLVLAGSAFAGMPLHSNEQECSMGEMDCCMKAALDQSGNEEGTGARLCCVLNCSQNGSRPPSVKVPQPAQSLGAIYPTTTSALLPAIPPFRRVENLHGPPEDSHPTYIRNHSLLI